MGLRKGEPAALLVPAGHVLRARLAVLGYLAHVYDEYPGLLLIDQQHRIALVPLEHVQEWLDIRRPVDDYLVFNRHREVVLPPERVIL